MTIELEEPELLYNNNKLFLDLFGGTVGGIAQVLVGQPFDTVKVRLQSAPEGTYNGTGDVIKKLIKYEGFSGFYKGTLSPLIGVGACVSVQFSVNEFMKRHFDNAHKGAELGLLEYFYCGAAAGFASGFLSSPIEHIRIRLQTQVGDNKLFDGPIDCCKKLYASNGIKSIFKGLAPTLVRDSIGLGAYFATYEALVNREIKLNGLPRSEIQSWKLCLFGGLAGYTLWAGIYPVDVIKSKLQADSLTSPKFKSSSGVFKDILRTNGVKGLYKGFLPTILRAAPANGATFAAFEITMRYIS